MTNFKNTKEIKVTQSFMLGDFRGTLGDTVEVIGETKVYYITKENKKLPKWATK